MSVAYVMNFSGATLGQYDQIIEKMGLDPGGPTPDGALFHWVAQTDAGILVVDVWESEQAFDQFSAEKIGPFSREVGITQAPEITKHAVHNHLGGAS